MLTSSQADIIRQLMVGLSLGTLVEDAGSWPIYANFMPDQPDNSLCVYNTEGRKQGRTGPDKESQILYGAQIRVRGTTDAIAYAKTVAIALAFDGVLRSSVLVNSTSFLVNSVNLAQPIIPLGSEVNSKRRLYTINVLSSITQNS